MLRLVIQRREVLWHLPTPSLLHLEHPTQLKELSGGRTRLVVSGYASARPLRLQAIANFVFWEPTHLDHADAPVRELKRRAERWSVRSKRFRARPGSRVGQR
jgi:hypothetical protein